MFWRPLGEQPHAIDGKKYVLGVRSGASENATVTTALLDGFSTLAGSLAPTDSCRLFVVDGVVEGATQRDRPGVRRRQRGTALSQPHAAECRRPPAERAARPGTGHPARRLGSSRLRRAMLQA